MGNAIKDNATKLDIYEKEIKTLQKKLDKAKKAAAKLLNLAIEKVISKGTTYSEKWTPTRKKSRYWKINYRRLWHAAEPLTCRSTPANTS